MKPKHLVTELSILIALYLLVAIGGFVLFKVLISNAGINIRLHDTCFSAIFSLADFTLLPFLLLTTFVYLIRATVYRFGKRLVNIILIISNLLFIILMLNAFRIIVSLQQQMVMDSKDWALYPPLSALGKQQSALPPTANPHYDNYFITIISIFMLILTASSVLAGKNWNTITYE